MTLSSTGTALTLPEERRQLVLEKLHQDGKVVASDLSALFGVSEDTVRRDLRELDEAGLLKRVHGGALPRSPGVASYTVRERQNVAAKATIAKAAAALVRQDQVVFLDSGTTTLEVARHFPKSLRATVVTNSPPIAVALCEHPDLTVVVTGGTLNKASLALTGTAALGSLAQFRADICLLGICSLHLDAGITVIDLEEAHVKRAMVQGAAEVVAVTTADKLSTAAPFVVAPLHDLTHLVTEQVDEGRLEPYHQLGISVTQA